MDELVENVYEDGQKISPSLPEGVKNYLIDIDGTVGEDIPNEEPERMATAEAFHCSRSNKTITTLRNPFIVANFRYIQG